MKPGNHLLLTAAASILFAGCHMVKSDDDLIEAAKVETRKEILSEYELEGEIVFKDLHVSGGEGDGILGTVCGAFTDSGSSDDQTPTRFIYMAIDDDTLLEEVLEDVTEDATPELLKVVEEANKQFNELWNDGCK